MAPVHFFFGSRCSVFAACLLAYLSACRGPGRPPADGVSAPAAPAEVGSAAAAIDFDTRVHDFGLVNEGTALRHLFQVKNNGTAPLVVSEVSTSCGCTAAVLGTKTLPPGGITPLEVTMDSHGARGKGARSITVRSNDPRQPTSVLEIRYDVERLLGLDRWFVSLTARPGQRRVEQVWLTGDRIDQARPRIAGIEGGSFVTARVVEDRLSGRLRKGLRLELRGQKPTAGRGHVTVATGLSDPLELSLPFEYVVD
jgi:hypothetical protein